ncbi:MAG: hypothetical protein V3U65_13480 [Granulosicoccaceae bacterium]
MTVTTQRRLHRARAAEFLAPLQAANATEGQADIDWVALDAVPHWCFEPPEYTNKLQLVSGAMFLAPAIRNWIDGKRIQELRALLGPIAFAAVARSSAVTGSSENFEVAEDVPEALARGGASVMLGAIDNADVRALLGTLFPMDVEPIDQSIANAIYEISLSTVHQAIVAEKTADNKAAAQAALTAESPVKELAENGQ